MDHHCPIMMRNILVQRARASAAVRGAQEYFASTRHGSYLADPLICAEFHLESPCCLPFL